MKNGRREHETTAKSGGNETQNTCLSTTEKERNETWLPVVGYESFYEVSDAGNVRRIESKVNLKPFQTGKGYKQDKGYLTVRLYCGSGKETAKSFKVHNLVLTAFHRPREGNEQVCHNDGNSLNNNLQNLRWDTGRSNTLDKIRHGTFNWGTGEDSLFAKLTNEDVLSIKELHSQGISTRKIAAILNNKVHHSSIWLIVSGKAWKHFNG